MCPLWYKLLFFKVKLAKYKATQNEKESPSNGAKIGTNQWSKLSSNCNKSQLFFSQNDKFSKVSIWLCERKRVVICCIPWQRRWSFCSYFCPIRQTFFFILSCFILEYVCVSSATVAVYCRVMSRRTWTMLSRAKWIWRKAKQKAKHCVTQIRHLARFFYALLSFIPAQYGYAYKVQ